MDRSNIHKLVSLTFDEDPKIRIGAATSLSKSDDPAAVFALMELSYDKDIEVKELAQKLLQEKKSSEQEVMSFAELFSSRQIQDDFGSAESLTTKEKVLYPITQLFEKKLGKERADAVKKKMMPTIEKIYLKHTKKKKDTNGKAVIQEFLTSYLEAISDIDLVEGAEIEIHAPVVEQISLKTEVVQQEHLTPDIEEVGTAPYEPSSVIKEIDEISSIETNETKEIDELKTLPDSMFKKAYELMLFSEGDEGVMKDEMKRILLNTERDLKLAFGLAKRKFKETKITHLTKIKDGMRNVNTDLLHVKSVERLEYDQKRAKKELTRVVLEDAEGSEGILYIFDERGSWLRYGMNIKIVKGYVKNFKFSGETGLTISKSGNIYIVL
ncbi:MAG TPA: hypothetical protein VI912_03160 [Candidatus Bilamarchaeaceae archaeon]|nr:hypothetical protein [Candidatus Bilamarchaeaceae archaeon]